MKRHLILGILNIIIAVVLCVAAVTFDSIAFFVAAGLFLLSGVLNLALHFYLKKFEDTKED